MNGGVGEALDELKVKFCLLHMHQKRKGTTIWFRAGGGGVVLALFWNKYSDLENAGNK